MYISNKIVARVLDKCDDDNYWIFFFFYCLLKCSRRVNFSFNCVLSSRVSLFLHSSESFASRDFFHDQREFRRTRDEVSSISRRETNDSLQILIHFLNKNHDYQNHEVFTCIIYNSNNHRSRSFDASTTRFHLLESQRYFSLHFACKYYD